MSVRNRTRGTILVKTLLNFNSHFRETLHFLNRTGIPNNCAIWITPCHAVYTVGIARPVDIAFLNRECRVVKILRNYPPNCHTLEVPEAVGALELPPNRLSESKTRTGDLLELDPC
jgi:hypothetical protein